MGFFKGLRKFAVVIGLLGAGAHYSETAIRFESDLLTINEGGGVVELKILRDAAEVSLAVGYRINFNSSDATADFETTTGTMIFAVGQTEATVSVRPRRDGRVEGTEIFELVVGERGSGARLGSATVRLMDEQTAVGRDYAFTPMGDASFVCELPDGSLLMRTPIQPGSQQYIARRLLPNGEWLAGWAGDGFATQAVNGAFIYGDGSMLLNTPDRVNYGQPPYLRVKPDGTTDGNWTVPLRAILGFQAGGKVIGLDDMFQGVRYTIDGNMEGTFHDFNPSREWIRSAIILNNDSIIVLRDTFVSRPYLSMYAAGGAAVQLPEPIYSSGPMLGLRGGGFAAVVFESNAEDAAVGLGIFDAQGNRKSFGPVSGVSGLARFGDGLALYGGPVRYRGREDNFLFVNPEGNVLTSLVPLYNAPVIVRPGGKLLAYPANPMPRQPMGYTQFALPNSLLSEIDFADSEIAVFEGTTAKVRVRRRGDTTQAANVTVRVKSADVASLPAVVRFEPLQSETALDVPIAGNPLPEMDRALEFVLTDASGATVGEIPAMRLRVMDDDGRPGAVEAGDGRQWHIDESWASAWTNSFGEMEIRALANGPGGRTYVVARKAGWSQAMAFDQNGNLDQGFTPFPALSTYTMATQSDGKLLAAGELREMSGRGVNSIARYTPTGQFDPTFAWGDYTAHGIYTVAVQPDDKILVGGLLHDFRGGGSIVRLLKNGGIDPSFSIGTDRFYYTTCLALQADGKIVFSCRGLTTADALIARANGNGSLDTSFSQVRGTWASPVGPHALTARPDGKILIGFGPELRSLTSSGTADSEFKLGPPPDGDVSEIINLPDGKILVAGLFKHIGGFERGGLARLNADGSVDTTFDPGVGAPIRHALALPGGDYLVGGDFQTFNLLPIKNLAVIKASVTPRFVLSQSGDGVETWFTANPGARVTFEQSSDLKTWEFLETRGLDNFSTTLAPVQTAAGATFVRAKMD